MQRPNFLIIYTDQQRWDALGANGNPDVHTPNLDRLADQGIKLNAPLIFWRGNLENGRFCAWLAFIMTFARGKTIAQLKRGHTSGWGDGHQNWPKKPLSP